MHSREDSCRSHERFQRYRMPFLLARPPFDSLQFSRLFTCSEWLSRFSCFFSLSYTPRGTASRGTLPILKATSSRRKLLLLHLRCWIETFISERKSRERQGSLDSRNWSLTRSFHGRVSGIFSNGDVGRLMVTQRWHGIGKEGRLTKGSESVTVTFIRKVRGVASNYAHNDPRRRASTEDFSSEWRQITSDVSLLNDQYWILIVYKLTVPFRKRTIK